MSIRKTGKTFLIAGVILTILPFAANAKSLTISNATKKPFTVAINGHCSSEFGVVQINSQKVVAEDSLLKACNLNSDECIAQIFKSDNCSGKQIAGFVFDAKSGVKGDGIIAPKYSITINYALNLVLLNQAINE